MSLSVIKLATFIIPSMEIFPQTSPEGNNPGFPHKQGAVTDWTIDMFICWSLDI